jgi:hypothetical protein
MPRGGARVGAGRPKGKRDGTLRDGLEEVKAALPVLVPPKLIVDADEKDAAAQANTIMQHAGQMAEAYRKLNTLKHLKERGLKGVRLITSDAWIGLVSATEPTFVGLQSYSNYGSDGRAFKSATTPLDTPFYHSALRTAAREEGVYQRCLGVSRRSSS